MPKIMYVEKQIWDLEEFAVDIINQNGRAARSDKKILASYNIYERKAKNSMTVTEWKNKRFKTNFPGFDVNVLNGDGTVVNGHTKLGTVRDSYNED